MTLSLADIIFAVFAGLISVFSACGTPLLLVYLAHPGTGRGMRDEMQLGITYAAGIALIFGALGAIAVLLGRAVLDLAPVLIVLAGTFLIALGTIRLAATSFGFQLGLLSKLMGAKYGPFSQGLNFGIASFGCSAPVLFALVGYGIARGGLATSLATVLLYVLAMIIPVLLLSVFKESARQTLSGIKRLLPLTEKVGIILPVAVGVYLIALYYYAYFPFSSR